MLAVTYVQCVDASQVDKGGICELPAVGHNQGVDTAQVGKGGIRDRRLVT